MPVKDVVQREVSADKGALGKLGSAARDVASSVVRGTKDNLRAVGEATRYAGQYYRSKLSSRRSSGR